MKKRCGRCQRVKSHTQFFANKSRKDGLDEYCKECRYSYYESRKKQNPAYQATVRKVAKAYYYRHRPKLLKKNRLLWKEKGKKYRAKYLASPKGQATSKLASRRNRLASYGMTFQDYDNLVKKQKRKCAICRQNGSGRELLVDHDHSTGVVRGLLCLRCNFGLGSFADNPLYLVAAARYLRRAIRRK